MSTAITETKAARMQLKQALTGESFRAEVAKSLPKHLKPERFIRIAVTALTRTPKLAECDQHSFFKALIDLSSYGLEPDGRLAHLIPFENRRAGIVECQLIIDYKGLIALAKRSGDVATWNAMDVCENDDFQWENGNITHRIDWRKDRGKQQCYYSHVKLKTGEDDYEVMTIAEVEAIRKRSKAANSGPWVTDFGEMGKKTVIRRHSKRLTLSAEFRDALATQDDDDFEARAESARRVEGVDFELPAANPFKDPEADGVESNEAQGEPAKEELPL